MRKFKFIACFIISMLLIDLANGKEPTVIVYPAPTGEALNTSYTVKADGKDVPVYNAKVPLKANMPRTKGIDTGHWINSSATAAFAYFDMEGDVNITVSIPGNVNSVKVLPSSAGITPILSAHGISFNISKPQNLTIEINGEYVESLHLFANPIDASIPDPKDPNVIFYGPGIHQISHLSVGSNKTVYIAGGAILQATTTSTEKFTVNKNDGFKNYQSSSIELSGKNITLRGRGIIDGGLCTIHARNMLLLNKGSNIKIEGVILRDASLWTMPIEQCDSVVVDNVKIIGYRPNSDGVDICNSHNVTVKNCFIRTYDDLIVVKTFKGRGDVEHVIAQNCVLWSPLAHALSIGAEIQEPVQDVLFNNCDVIHDLGREWTLRVFQSDAATVSNVRFENIRVEESHQLISLWIGKAVWTRDNAFGHIHDISFKNITAKGNPLTINLVGVDGQHQVENVNFSRITLNNKPLNAKDIKTTKFITGLTITP